ncbi:MAG: carbon-nitrogen hydrolase family protein [Synergistaceae bacterium]|jgi:predicted amidohydrolase|nr:carbon-nitrogen hydrolase family protein [Synergistaceae bacterium]
MSSFLMGVIQINSTDDKKHNLEKLGSFIDEAVKRGARMCATSETVAYVGKPEDEVREQEPIPGPTSEFFAQKARQHKIWLHCGSYLEANPQEPARPFNTNIVINPKGDVVARYRKIHMYDVEIQNGPSFKESATRCPGSEIVVFDSDFGRMGLSICYDMRFPELYRLLTLKGAKVLFVPALYMLYTGKDHWETVLRTRAIENQCYVVAPDQIGVKTNGAHAYGRSLVIDPWGNVVAKASDKECVLVTEIDMGLVDAVREQLPSLKNRVPDAYKG